MAYVARCRRVLRIVCKRVDQQNSLPKFNVQLFRKGSNRSVLTGIDRRAHPSPPRKAVCPGRRCFEENSVIIRSDRAPRPCYEFSIPAGVTPPKAPQWSSPRGAFSICEIVCLNRPGGGPTCGQLWMTCIPKGSPASGPSPTN